MTPRRHLVGVGLGMVVMACATPPDTPGPSPQDAFSFPPLSAGAPIDLAAGPPPRRQVVDVPEPMTLWDAGGDWAILQSASAAEDTHLLSLSTGVLRSIAGRPHTFAQAADLLALHPTALLPLQAAQPIVPVVTTPAGTAQSTVIMLSDDGQVHLLASDAEGKLWHGPWRDLGQATIAIESALPQTPRGMGWDDRGRPVVWTASGIPGDGQEADCVRWRLDAATPRCVAVVNPDPTAQHVTLSDGIAAVDAWGEPLALYRDDQPIPWRLEPECDWNLSLSMDTPPRVLADCHPDRESAIRERRLWSPTQQIAWQQNLPPSQRGMFRNQRITHPVVYEAIPNTEPPLAVRWLDVVSLRGWSSAPWVPLRTQDQPHPALARSPDTGEVMVVDVEAGVWHALTGAGEDCPVELVEIQRSDAMILLRCHQRTSTTQYRYQHHFSHIIDLQRRQHWHIEAMVEAILPDGRVLVSDREHDVAEESAPFAALEIWDLGEEPDSPRNQ